MPRNRNPRRWDSVLGAGLAVAKRQAAAGDKEPAAENTAAPGFREHPPRSGLGRVERDNPVGVRTLVRSADREGGPTPRRGTRMGGPVRAAILWISARTGLPRRDRDHLQDAVREPPAWVDLGRGPGGGVRPDRP